MAVDATAVYDVLCIGLGPAGYGALHTLDPRWSIAMVDAGGDISSRETREHPSTVFVGSGGASIINDGKWSFDTCGSACRLLPAPLLTSAKAKLLQELGCDTVPSLPEGLSPTETPAPEAAAAEFVPKLYASVRTSLADRVELVHRWEAAARIKADVLLHTRIIEQRYDDDRKLYVLRAVNTETGEALAAPLLSRALINATGRLGPLSLPPPTPSHSTFRRLEVGLRLHCNDVTFTKLQRFTNVLNPTFVWNSTVSINDVSVPIQYRSFCWCRHGEVVEGDARHLGLETVLLSGRSDGVCEPDTNNVGITARVMDEASALASGLFDDLSAVLAAAPFSIAASSDLLSELPLPQSWASALSGGVAKFLTDANVTTSSAALTLSGPCVEGVGAYLDAHPGDTHLRIRDYGPAAFVAGDASGTFRGLTPAYSSGFAVGTFVSQYLEDIRLAALQSAFDEVRGLYAPPTTIPTRLPFTPPPLRPRSLPKAAVMLENHVFLAPLNPSPAVVDTYRHCVEVYNKHVSAVSGAWWKPMKGPYLALLFRPSLATGTEEDDECESKTKETEDRRSAEYVNVLQAARYVPDNDLERSINAAYSEDAALFASAGFPVLRVKVESTMHGVDGVPTDSASADAFLKEHNIYSEHHVRCQYTSADMSAVPSVSELRALEDLCGRMQDEIGVTVALSYNHKVHEDPEKGAITGRQRFLNIRTRGLTNTEALGHVERLRKAIGELEGTFTARTSIDEWVVHDTYPQMDRRWIDPERSSVVIVSGKRFAGKDFFSSRFCKAAAVAGVEVRIFAIADYAKRAYCKQVGLPLDALIGQSAEVRALKETHREDLSEFFRSSIASDPFVFLREPYLEALEWLSNRVAILVVTDCRLKQDLEFLKDSTKGKAWTRTLRVEATVEAKAARGWVKAPVDDNWIEQDLDDYPFDRVVHNNSQTPDEIDAVAKSLLAEVSRL